MEDRFKSFLVLCQELNYRKTAQIMHMSQPAITKQIQSIERDYQVKLFSYDGRRLSLTDAGKLMRRYMEAQRYQEQELLRELSRPQGRVLRLGATKSVGDHLLTPYLTEYLKDKAHTLSLMVDNTQRLLTLLDASELDFAVIEGFFDKQQYSFRLIREEPFVGVCARSHPFAGQVIAPSDLSGHSVILREEGSGTRRILERSLAMLGYDAHIFSRVITTSSTQVIKALVAEGIGISFMYDTLARTDDRLATFTVAHMTASHEFNAVWLKHTDAGTLVTDFFKGQ